MKKTLFATLSLIMVLSLALTACGGGKATQAATEVVVVTEPPATEPPAPVGQLLIWADDTRTPILTSLADQFLADYNVELVVEDLGVVQDIRSQAIIAIPAGEGPDIYLGVHDWLGALVASGLVAPIDLGDKAGEFVPSTLDAFTYTDGNLYGLPYATENLGFFYNTDLVTTVPTTWDEVLEVGRTLKAEGKVQYAIAVSTGPLYNAFPIQTAFGGYVFGVDDTGAWNPQDVGIDSPGEIAAVAWMAGAVEEGLMPNTFDYETAHSLFETGQIPFLMAGPWALDRIRASGVPYAIATSFPDNGVPFSGVQGFFVNPYSENVLLAQTFLTEYVATEATMQMLYETGLRPSAFQSVLDQTADPDLKAMGQSGINAIPMPNIPEMGSVWTATDNGITLAVTGEMTPEAAMTDAAAQIRSLIAGALVDMINLPGTFQDQAGCGGTWDPACEATGMVKGDDGLYRLTVELTAGSYEYKVAMAGAWTENYGSDGKQDGPNYTFTLDAAGTVTFVYNPETHLVEMTVE